MRGILPGPVLVAGDFNAKGALWGSRRPDAKGLEVLNWAARLGLHLLNRGAMSTCVRPQGESIVDLTWASPAVAGNVISWRVIEETDILSDHLPIEVEIGLQLRGRDGPEVRPKRWTVSKFDPDRLVASLAADTWLPSPQERGIEEQAKWLREVMERACDNSIPGPPLRRVKRRTGGARTSLCSEEKQSKRGVRCREPEGEPPDKGRSTWLAGGVQIEEARSEGGD
ncbi:PREDICTED: uncharacterized protein LOC105559000 [Vollenhovia emeryi]|uniref:uncharacterized protein LOC105559000 n=1 Tax=Vollenhovia emeryi TaxID=411798 RepID=UPI0005F3996F|nr:PREDICTED: uncharacterized protein LOC105559000 [Vollenhovia emeryi]